MTHHQDDHLTVHIGDCREVLRELPAESVHCVVTSPPYWGLRDYGTATWLGGDEGCDHRAPPKGGPPSASTLGPKRDGLGPDSAAWAESKREHQFAGVCRKCGATRQDSQLGLEPTPEAYVANMVEVFREVRRVLRKDGTCWVNMGDGYASHDPGGYRPGEFLNPGGRVSAKERAEFKKREYEAVKDIVAGSGRNRAGQYRPGGLKPKDLIGMPWRLAFALQADGWYLRSDIIWAKPNPMPESVTDRPTKSHEYVFLLTKSARYFYDAEAVREQNVTQGDRREGNGRFAYDGKYDGQRDDGTQQAFVTINPSGRNLRSVWQIATEPYPTVKVRNVGEDGQPDTVSPDCPVHSPLASQRSPRTDEGDGLPSPDPSRSPGIARRPAPAPVFGQPASSSLGSRDARQPTPDWLVLEGSGSTTDANVPESRTPAPPTDGDGRVATARTDPRTNHTPASPMSRDDAASLDADAATGRNGHESRTTVESEPLGSASRSTADRTPDTDDPSERGPSGCSCPEYISTSHFATFPQKLVEPCIKAGTSERGVCPECGAPWVREVERTSMVLDRSERTHPMGRTRTSGTMLEAPTAKTTGWQRTCEHPHKRFQAIPATVLDCFAGSGTTGLVANRLGRRAILIDLSADYIDQAMIRNAQKPLGLIG